MPNRYLVHGVDRASGQRVRKVIEAASAHDAEAVAARLGLDVIGTEVDAGTTSDTSPAVGTEETVWSGTPSLWSQFWWFVAAGALVLVGLVVGILGLLVAWVVIPLTLLIGAVMVIVRVLVARSRRFTLTNQRLRIESGIIARRVEEIELYRVIDSAADQSVIQRLLGVGTVVVVSNDERNPQATLPWVPGPRDLRERVRQLGEARRRWRKVAEIDVS